MKVSVCIVTYNHEPYIARAIEGALMQQTDFPYEIVIGEDDSSDNTRAIVNSYGERYPDKIRLLLNDRSNVIYISGRPTGRWNFVNTLKHAQGKYIALCEGDDYWTDPTKLQKQVDFLENHPECAICFHNVLVVWEDGSQAPRCYCSPDQKESSSLVDLFRDNFIPTCSVMYRGGLVTEFPNWFYQLPQGDWPLHILHAQYGNIGYIDEVMGVYRKHSAGVWSLLGLRGMEAIIQVLEAVDAHFQFRYETIIKSEIFRYRYRLTLSYEQAGELTKARTWAKSCVFDLKHNQSVSTLEIIKMLFRVYLPIKSMLRSRTPAVYRAIRSIKETISR